MGARLVTITVSFCSCREDFLACHLPLWPFGHGFARLGSIFVIRGILSFWPRNALPTNQPDASCHGLPLSVTSSRQGAAYSAPLASSSSQSADTLRFNSHLVVDGV